MPQTIEYEEKHFIIINDIENSLFYFFDFDVRSTEKNMEFEHLHSYYEIHILLSPMATHFIEGIPYRIRTNDFVLLDLPAFINPFTPVIPLPRGWSSPLCTATTATALKIPMKIS